MGGEAVSRLLQWIWPSTWKWVNKVVADIFTLCDARVCSVGVAPIHSRLSAATHHRIIYNSVPRLSRREAGSSADDSNNYKPLMPQSIPCMPVHGHVDTHTRVVTFGSSLTSAGGEEGGFGSLYLSVTQMLNDVYHDCAYVHVPPLYRRCLFTENSLSTFFPSFCSPLLHLCASVTSVEVSTRLPRLREFSSTCLDAKHSHFWSDDTNPCIHERRAQQFTENVPARWISFPLSSKGEDLFWWHSECAAGSCCFCLRNWNGAAVISWSLLSWTSCLTACHRGIDPLSLSAALHGKWYSTAGKDLHLSRWVKRFRSYLLWRKKKKNMQACTNSIVHICLNNLQRHSALNIVGSLSDSQRCLNVVDTHSGVSLKKKFEKTQFELRSRWTFLIKNVLLLHNDVKKMWKGNAEDRVMLVWMENTTAWA